MFTAHLANEINSKPKSFSTLTLSTIVIFALAYGLICWLVGENEGPEYETEKYQASVLIASQVPPALSSQLSEAKINDLEQDNPCAELADAYDLLAIVFDQDNLVALIKLVETGVTLLLDKKAGNETAKETNIELKAADFNQAKFQMGECHFTLFLNEYSD